MGHFLCNYVLFVNNAGAQAKDIPCSTRSCECTLLEQFTNEMS